MALGADRSRIRSLVVWQGIRLAIVGVVIGIAAAFGLTRFISSFLFGVKTRDPLVFVTVPILLSLIALLAVWVPATDASPRRRPCASSDRAEHFRPHPSLLSDHYGSGKPTADCTVYFVMCSRHAGTKSFTVHCPPGPPTFSSIAPTADELVLERKSLIVIQVSLPRLSVCSSAATNDQQQTS